MFCDVHTVVAEAQPIPVQSKAFPGSQGEGIPWGKTELGTSSIWSNFISQKAGISPGLRKRVKRRVSSKDQSSENRLVSREFDPFSFPRETPRQLLTERMWDTEKSLT